MLELGRNLSCIPGDERFGRTRRERETIAPKSSDEKVGPDSCYYVDEGPNAEQLVHVD